MSKNGSSSVVSLLDLPESPLENILQRLSAVELCIMSQVSTHLNERCTTDYLWENILKQKWSKLIGHVARQEWNLLVESRKRKTSLIQHKHNGTLGSLRGVWPSLFLGSYLEDSGHQPNSSRTSSDHDSVKALYICLEKGRFWFPAQAYTRAGSFVMYCYDVLLSYDSRTNTFRSRYRHDGWRKIEENIPWDRVKATLVESPPDVLHQSDSLDDLVPGDHIEVQWRRAKGIPYDWWYATVGHLGSCTGNEHHRCHCHHSDMLMVEFKQYSVGSPYRQVVLNKNGHDEQIVGGGGGGCYGGIRKLRREEEIARWKMILASANSNSRGAPPVAAIAPYYYNV